MLSCINKSGAVKPMEPSKIPNAEWTDPEIDYDARTGAGGPAESEGWCKFKKVVTGITSNIQTTTHVPVFTDPMGRENTCGNGLKLTIALHDNND